MTCCRLNPSQAAMLASRAAACALCAGLDATECPEGGPIGRRLHLTAFGSCPRGLHPRRNGMVGRWIGVAAWRRAILWGKMCWRGETLPPLPGCGCWAPLKNGWDACKEGRLLMFRALVATVLVLGSALLANGCDKQKVLGGGGAGSPALHASQKKVAEGAEAIRQESGKIQKAATELAPAVPGRAAEIQQIGGSASTITARAEELQRTAAAIGEARVVIEADQSECLKLRRELDETKKRLAEAQREANSATRRTLTVIAVGASLLVGVFLFMRSFWLAGAAGTVAVCCFAITRVISAIDAIPNWAVWTAFGLLAAIVAWKLLADDTVQGKLVQSVDAFVRSKAPDVKDEWKSVAAKVQGPAVSKIVHRFKARLGIDKKKEN